MKMFKKDRKSNYQRFQNAKAVYLTRAGWEELGDGHWAHPNLVIKQLFGWAVELQEGWDRAGLKFDIKSKKQGPEFNYDTDQMSDGG